MQSRRGDQMIIDALKAIASYWPEIELILYALENKFFTKEKLTEVVKQMMTEASDAEMKRELNT